MHHTSLAAPDPIPRTRRGEKYEVRDPDLTVLHEQNVWGRISVTRNERLVQGRETSKDFILHIRKVRAAQPATPLITITQKLEVADRLGPLADRLAEFLASFLFPDGAAPTRERQLVSLAASFTRALFQGETAPATPGLSDATALFAPVVTTPALAFGRSEGSGDVVASAVALHLAEYLEAWLDDRKLAPIEHWTLALRLFSEIQHEDAQSPLLELTDLRVRMADQ